jgi:hypothetical protein
MLMDVFGFLFETDGTEDVKSELSQIDKKTQEVKQDTDKLSTSFSDLTRALAPLAAAYGVLKASMDFSREAEQIGFLSQMSGVSAQSLGELGFAAAQFGGDINSAAAAVMGLQRNILQLRRTGSGPLVQAGMMYGINISTDPEQMLKNIAKRFETLSTPMQMDLGHMLGLDNATIMMLQGGLQQFTEQLEKAKKYTFIDDKMVERARALMKVNRENSAIWEGIKNVLVDYINPFVIGLLEVIRDIGEYLFEHKTIAFTIAAGIGAIAVAMLPIEKIGAAVLGFFQGWGGALVAVTAAIALIGDDVDHYLKGANSLLGELVQQFPELKGAVDSTITAIKNMWDALKSGEAWNTVKAQFNAWSSEIAAFWDRFSQTKEFERLKNVFTNLQPELTVIKNVFKSIQDIAGAVFDKVGGIISQMTQWYTSSDGTMNIFRGIAAVIETIIKGITRLTALITGGLTDAISSVTEGFKSLTDYFSDGGGYEQDKTKVLKYIQEVSASDFNPLNWFSGLQGSQSMERTISTVSTNNLSTISNDSHANTNNVQASITNNFYPSGNQSGAMYGDQVFAEDFNSNVLGHLSSGGK